jgi:hypothetical protein
LEAMLRNAKILVNEKNLSEIAQKIVDATRAKFELENASDEFMEHVVYPWIDRFTRENYVVGEFGTKLDDEVDIKLGE